MSLFDFDDLGATLESHEATNVDAQAIDLEAIYIPVEEKLTSEVELFKNSLQFDMLERAEEDYENMMAELEESLEEGGMRDQKAVTMFRGYYLTVSKPLGVAEDTIPTVESFENSAEVETRFALESIRKNVATAGKFVMDLLRKAYEFFKNLIMQFFDRATKTRKIVGQLREALKTAKGKPAKDKLSVKNARFIGINGTLSTMKVAQSIGKDKGLIDKFKGFVAAAEGASAEGGSGKVRELATLKNEIGSHLTEALQVKNPVTEEIKKKAKLKSKKGKSDFADMKMGPVMEGGERMVVGIPTEGGTLGYSFRLIQTEEFKSNELPALDTSGIAKYLGEAEERLNEHDMIIEIMNPLNEQIGKLAKASVTLQKTAKAAKKMSTEAMASATLASLMKYLPGVLTDVHKALASNIAGSALARASYAHESLKNLKDGAAAPAKEEPKKEEPAKEPAAE